MNIYITKDDKKIENFTNISIKNFQKEISDIINNSCENIIADDIIDFINSESIEEFVKILILKLRMNGKLMITGMDLGILCRMTVDETIQSKDFSAVIAPRASLSFSNNINEMLIRNGLSIECSTIKGLKYEISATRK